jgi:hypothetical protein
LNPGWVDGDLDAASWGHAPKQVKFLCLMVILFQSIIEMIVTSRFACMPDLQYCEMNVDDGFPAVL